MANPAPSLKVLAEDKTVLGISKATTFRVSPYLINFEEGFNLRAENDELEIHIERLYNAMKAGAFIPPVDVSVIAGRIIARDGHCRTRAGRRLQEEMPEFTLECRQLRGNEADAVLHMLGTGGGSKPLTPLEQGRGYLRLINMGLKPVDIAAKLGVSRVTVDNGLTLAEAPVEVQQMVANGEVSSTTARDAIKQGPEGVAALTIAVKAERAAPTTKKNGKKGSVTAKKLRGTKADKKTVLDNTRSIKEIAGVASIVHGWTETQANNGKVEKAKDAIPAPTPARVAEATTYDPSIVSIQVHGLVAKATVGFLREFGGGDLSLKVMADAIEAALM